MATVVGLMRGEFWLWTAVVWSPPSFVPYVQPEPYGTVTIVTLLVAAAIKALFLWLILRAPRPGPLSGRERALRRLLYLAVAYSLILWWPFAVLPDEVAAVVQLIMWGAIDVLLLLVIRWRSRVLRAAAGVMFAIQILVMVEDLLDELDIWEFGWNDVAWWIYIAVCAAATVLTVVGQWRDGRWSRGTLIAGWLSLISFAFDFPIITFFEPPTSAWLASMVVSHVLGLLGVVWNAATAREMPVAAGHPVAASSRRRWGWGHRVALAAVVVLPMVVVIQPEQNARHTFGGGSPDCYSRPSFGDLKPEEREPVFLCLARNRDFGQPPMFPDSLPDQAVLAYGRALCRAKDRTEKEALLRQAGSARAAWGVDDWDLVYVCPEIVAKSQPHLLRSSEQMKADERDHIAEKNARCRDPWPRTKGVVQATANYFLFVDGDPGYVVTDAADHGVMDEDVMGELYKKGNETGLGVTPGTVLVGHVADVSDVCITVKAFRKAPPPRTAGWYSVHEVPITSRSGTLKVPEMDGGEVGAGAPMPNLAIRGKGRYRLRVYVRVTKSEEEEHLVVVFPGRSRKQLALKS
ncbi:hypothetical protein ACFFR3_42485 [Nonomuraea salmonea]|uniref:Uncharacterized protein n=1 Tax=Nonomuraea salmonea TaxID=46181 RepID=A0ABV5P0W1_9ACTN